MIRHEIASNSLYVETNARTPDGVINVTGFAKQTRLHILNKDTPIIAYCRERIEMRILVLFALVILALNGCSWYAYTNTRLTSGEEPKLKAAFRITEDRGSNQKVLVVLALSGGGSRAAYWSASVMLKLSDAFRKEGLDLLREVDAISSVSGGSLPAAYYAISRDTDDNSHHVISDQVWDRNTVKDLMSRNYIYRWIGNWFWPHNILRFWFTAYDRTDIMATVFADNLYHEKSTRRHLKFKDLNNERPYLIINSTNSTASESPSPSGGSMCFEGSDDDKQFGCIFTFTVEQLDKIKADLGDYEIARAVMASATFPGAFNLMTLWDYRNSMYLHFVRYLIY
jgi:Predicted esterase of the alpha-beta hydrolase superfamily